VVAGSPLGQLLPFVCTFEVVDFREARLFGANFSNALFIDVRFTHALYDQETQFPDGFDPRKAGAYMIAPDVDLKEAKLVNELDPCFYKKAIALFKTSQLPIASQVPLLANPKIYQ
jgi:uncharacterized protein YjbI with pentapeptide repeats